jgi:ligand-binding SRPBCC domain-containing protein
MKFRFERLIALPRSTVFAFHNDPAHLALLHRGQRAFRLLHHDGNPGVGSRTWFEINVGGILPVVLGFQHTCYDPPHCFGEQLIHGPFSRFSHMHEFDEVDGGTLVRDLLDVELPWYYGGELSMKTLVAPLLQRAFTFRGDALERLASTGAIGQHIHS